MALLQYYTFYYFSGVLVLMEFFCFARACRKEIQRLGSCNFQPSFLAICKHPSYFWNSAIFISLIIPTTYKNSTAKSQVIKLQGWRGHQTVNYTGTKCILFLFSYTLAKNFGNFYYIVIKWFQANSVKTFQPIIIMYICSRMKRKRLPRPENHSIK